jgi:chromosomal replication initiator protein
MIDGRFRFDNFVVGSANRLAVSAVRAVADSPGSVYNPLFIYSASGLGKTHLLGALGFAARSLHPDLHVEYFAVEDFVDQLHAAIASGQGETFRRRWQSFGVLLLDDVQFLTGRTETQSELLRVFNALQGSSRQIVMTSDRPPSEITDVDQRLITRLSGGLIVDIGAPDYETRVAILRHLCAERSIQFGSGVLEEVASAPTRNVRELQGALNRLVAQQAIANVPLAPHEARSVVRDPDVQDSPAEDEYESFLTDMAAAIAHSVEEWRLRLGERIARWSGEGFATDRLQRLLDQADAPDLEAEEARFAAICDRLRAIEAEAIRLDVKFTGMAVFRDPERLADAEDLLVRALALCDPPPGPRPELTFESIVAAPANQVALRAAVEVLSLPGQHYNPLVIVGPNHSGKSHLIHAIGNALAAREDGSWAVACVDADQFTDELIAAIQSDTVDRWRSRYRACDALIVDNVHRLAGKERTQEELFHLFNALHERGRQIVLASAVTPSQLTDIAPRLRSRMDGGLVAHLGRVTEAERIARHTPVPPGDEAAAPTIDTPFLTPAEGLDRLTAASGGMVLDLVRATPGIADTFFLDPEKVVTDWPDADGRAIEEPR